MDDSAKLSSVRAILEKNRGEFEKLLFLGDFLRKLSSNFWNLKAIVYLYLVCKFRDGKISISPDALKRISYVISRRSSSLDEFGLISSRRYQKVEDKQFSSIGFEFLNACVSLGYSAADAFNVDLGLLERKFERVFNVEFLQSDVRRRFLFLLLSVFVLSSVFNKSSLRNIRFVVLLSVYHCYRILGRDVDRSILIECLKFTGRYSSSDTAYIGKILDQFSVHERDDRASELFFDMFVSWVFTRFKEIFSRGADFAVDVAPLEKGVRVPLLVYSEKRGKYVYKPNPLGLYFFEKFIGRDISRIFINNRRSSRNESHMPIDERSHKVLALSFGPLDSKSYLVYNSRGSIRGSSDVLKYTFGVHGHRFSFGFGHATNNFIASDGIVIAPTNGKFFLSGIEPSSSFDLDNLLRLRDQESIIRFFRDLASESDDRILSFWHDLKIRTHSNIIVIIADKIEDIYALAGLIIDNIIDYGGTLTVFSGSYIGTQAGSESLILAHKSYIEKHKLLLKKLDTEYRKIKYERIYVPGSIVYDIYLSLSGIPEHFFENEVRQAVKWLKELIENRRKMNLKVVVNPLAQFNPFSIIMARIDYKIPLYYTELFLYSSGTRRFGTGIFFVEYESPKIYESLMKNVRLLKELNFTVPYQSADIRSYIYDVVVKTTENYLGFLARTNPEEAQVLDKIFDIFKREYKALIGLSNND